MDLEVWLLLNPMEFMANFFYSLSIVGRRFYTNYFYSDLFDLDELGWNPLW